MSEKNIIKQLIETKFDETNGKIESIKTALQTDIATIHTNLGQHNERITSIEQKLNSINESDQIEEIKIQIEMLKQDRLRNNIRLTGLPPIAFDNPNEAVLSIDYILQLGLIPSDFIVYADRHKSSLIVAFANHSHKRLFMSALQQRKSLLAEEVFPSIKSNSNIYANDQLTPYFAKLFHEAWQAKKEGRVYSASSLGGRIKVKQYEDSSAITISNHQQLNELLNDTHNDKAQTHSNRSLRERNDDSSTSNNNNNDSSNNHSKTETIPPEKGRQPASNNPPLQRFIDRKQLIQRHFRSSNQFSSKIRANLQQHRTHSRDRAYRGNIDFDISPPSKSSHHRSENRYKSYKRSPSPSPSHRTYGKVNHHEHSNSRNRNNRGRN